MSAAAVKGGIVHRSGVITGKPDTNHFVFPPLHQFVPMRMVLMRWEEEKAKLPQSSQGKLLQQIQVQCPKGKKYLEETLRLLFVLLQNQRYWAMWMEGEENRTLILVMLQQWLTRTNKKSGQALWCYMKKLPMHCHIHRQLGGIFRDTVTKLITMLKPYSNDVKQILKNVPGIVSEIESYCGLEPKERWFDTIVETLRLLAKIFTPLPTVESFSTGGDTSSCPPCFKHCDQCTCNAWSGKEKAAAAVVGICFGVFVIYAINRVR